MDARISLAVSMRTLHDIPGLILSPGFSFSENRSLTGNRWTIRVKFPVALSGGNKENADPVPPEKLSTQHEKTLPGIASTVTESGWPRRVLEA